LSCGDTIAEWKSIECIIGAAVSLRAGAGSSERLVIENLTRSPTFTRITGPGTWSPKVQAENFTPGAISMILCVVSSRISFTASATSGFTTASIDSALPCAYAPVCRSPERTAAEGFRSSLAGS
jgi:hypothetical protein